MDILYLVDRLENLIASSRRMPLMNQIIVKEADILTIIEQMRTSIPEEIKQARRINQERERILAQAQSEAKNILARAHEEGERALEREGLLHAAEERSHEMLRRATEQAQVIVRRAEEHTERLKNDADGYTVETLRNLREHLTNIETDIERTVLSIEKGLESLQGQASAIGEMDEERADSAPDQSTPAPSAPRRASLAADTLGAGPLYQQ